MIFVIFEGRGKRRMYVARLDGAERIASLGTRYAAAQTLP